MDYDWALEQISTGIPVKRSLWQDYAIKQDSHGDLHVCTVLSFMVLSSNVWFPTSEDEQAHDWEIANKAVMLTGLDLILPTREQLERAAQEGAKHITTLRSNKGSVTDSGARFKK